MLTLILCIIFMLIGYYLGTKETDKKWIEKHNQTAMSEKGRE